MKTKFNLHIKQNRHRKWFSFYLGLLFLAILSIPFDTSLASPLGVLNISQPDGINDTTGEGDDFATTILGDPWDMNEASDVSAYGDISNVAFAGGIMSFTTGNDPSISLLHQGYGGQSIGKTGEAFPINADKYYLLSFRMYSSVSDTAFIYWFYDPAFSKFAWSQGIPVQPGWHTYTINLKTIGLGGTNGGATGWNGQVTGLRLDPIGPAAGATIQLDWVRLTAPDTSYTLTISWSGVSGSTLDFYLDDDTSGCDGPQIAAIASPGASGNFIWGGALQPSAGAGQPYPLPVSMAPGNYYVCGKVDGATAFYSSGPLTVDSAPILRITHPSYLTGPDYGSNAGIPWDMNSAAAFNTINNFASYSFSGGQLDTVNTHGDPALNFNIPTPVDTSKYKYFSYRMYLEGSQDIARGWVSRMFWYDTPFQPTVTKDIIIYPGWNTYTLDLTQASLESGGQTWASKSSWQTLRFDPNENTTGQPWTSHFDYFLLTGDPTGQINSFVEIWYELSETSGVTVTLYYDTDQNLSNGRTLLTTGTPSAPPPIGPYFIYLPVLINGGSSGDLPQPSGTQVYWNTTGVSAGTYYIMAEVTDGYNTTYWYSDVPYVLSD